MRLLGIDYGSRRVGLALSDSTGLIAQAYAVWPRDAKLVDRLVLLCQTEKVEKIILGESRDFNQQPNPVMAEIGRFKDELEQAVKIPIIYEPEFLTSVEADRVGGKDNFTDARAAAIILRSYLERQRYQNQNLS